MFTTGPILGEAVSTMSEFNLTVQEQAVSGLKVADGKLTLRPTLPSIFLSCTYAAIGLGLMGLPLVRQSTLTMVLAGLGLAVALAGWRSASACVAADTNGIIVRNHWRTTRFGWDNVHGISVTHHNSRLGRFPYSSPWNPPHRFACGAINLRDGRQVMPDALVSLPPTELGDLLDASSTKVEALTRWATFVASEPGEQ